MSQQLLVGAAAATVALDYLRVVLQYQTAPCCVSRENQINPLEDRGPSVTAGSAGRARGRGASFPLARIFFFIAVAHARVI
jgi:hypothetical protein